MDPVILRTQRLELSVPRRADADAITAACQDAAISRWTTVPSPYTRDDADGFIAATHRWWRDEIEPAWAIRRRDRDGVGALLGMVSMRLRAQPNRAPANGMIGYWMSAPARGHGYLTEAAQAVIDFAFAPEGLDLSRIEWRAIVGNTGSARVAQRLGFRYEGRLRGAISSPLGREDLWVAGLLAQDGRAPQPWPALEDTPA